MGINISKQNNFTLEFLLNSLKGNTKITIFHLYGDEGSTLAFQGTAKNGKQELVEYFNEIVTFIEPYLQVDKSGITHPAFICEIKEIIKKEN